MFQIFGTPKNNKFSIWNKWKIYYFQVSQYLSTLRSLSKLTFYESKIQPDGASQVALQP